MSEGWQSAGIHGAAPEYQRTVCSLHDGTDAWVCEKAVEGSLLPKRVDKVAWSLVEGDP